MAPLLFRILVGAIIFQPSVQLAKKILVHPKCEIIIIIIYHPDCNIRLFPLLHVKLSLLIQFASLLVSVLCFKVIALPTIVTAIYVALSWIERLFQKYFSIVFKNLKKRQLWKCDNYSWSYKGLNKKIKSNNFCYS